MAFYFINPIVERAFVAFLKSKTFSWCDPLNIRKGSDNRDNQENEGRESSVIRTPYIIASCVSANPVLPSFRGNWDAVLEIAVGNSAEDTTDSDHADRASEVFGYFDVTEIRSNILSAYPDIYFAKMVPGPSEARINGRNWEAIRTWTLVSCAATHLAD